MIFWVIKYVYNSTNYQCKFVSFKKLSVIAREKLSTEYLKKMLIKSVKN